MSAIVVTAAKIAQCFSDSARAQIFNVILAEAVTKGQGLYQTTSGTFGLWDMTAAAKDEVRGVALEAGAAGEAISMLKYGPMYGLTLAGNHDSLVFASSDVAGGFDTAGVVSVGRVVALADASKTKVLFVDCYERPVENGWLSLALGYTHAGEYEDPVVDTSALKEFFSLWLKMTATNARGYGVRVNLENTGLSARTSQAIRAEYSLSHASGHVAAGGSAIHAAAYLGAGNDGVGQYLCGLSATIQAAAESRSLQGTFAALILQSEIGSGISLPAMSSFVRCADAGDVDLPLFLDLEGIGTGAGKAYDTNVNTPGADSNCTGYLRVLVSGGTVLGIPIFALN